MRARFAGADPGRDSDAGSSYVIFGSLPSEAVTRVGSGSALRLVTATDWPAQANFGSCGSLTRGPPSSRSTTSRAPIEPDSMRVTAASSDSPKLSNLRTVERIGPEFGTPGSHVVVRNPDKGEVPREIVERAAC